MNEKNLGFSEKILIISYGYFTGKLRVHYVIQELWAAPNRATPKSCYP